MVRRHVKPRCVAPGTGDACSTSTASSSSCFFSSFFLPKPNSACGTVADARRDALLERRARSAGLQPHQDGISDV